MKGLALLSGGIDSPVAIKTMQRHAELEAIHFHSYPLTNKESITKSQRLANLLGVTLHVVPFAEVQAQIRKTCRHDLYFVIMKRVMVRISERLAQDRDAVFLVTGENLGQVGSQTLTNLAVISHAAQIPLYRPLLCYNKEEIVALAKQYGTYDISKGPETCNLLGPKHPSTRAVLHIVEEEERKLDVEKMIIYVLKAAFPSEEQ